MKKTIAIVHPELGLAGPEAVAVWALQALKDEYKVHLVTCSQVDFNKINKFFGTTLNSEDLYIDYVPLPISIRENIRFRLLKQHFLMRFCKKHKRKFDLFFSTYNEMDFGKKGMQYIHFPSMDISYGAKYNLLIDRYCYRDSLFRKGYLWFSKMVSRYHEDKIKDNVTLVNSSWTKNIVRKIYDIDSTILYPPVSGDFPVIRWEKKEYGFVCLSRVEPDKRVCEIISILQEVKRKGFDIHLHVIGKCGLDKNYVDKFNKLVKDNNSWVFYEGVIPREKLVSLLSRHKYGIHGKHFEHFGIAVAEMVHAGCISFVYNDGGQVDIVLNNENLIYNTDEEAANKIKNVLNCISLQNSLMIKLKEQSNKYSIENFTNQLRTIVAKALGEEP